jgi:hypothetical protein
LVTPVTTIGPFFPKTDVKDAVDIGFRRGDKGTHTSRTIMLAELTSLLALNSPTANKSDYAKSIVEGNCLGKNTASTRRLTSQRLTELYALDSYIPIFGVLRNLWEIDPNSRALLALLCAVARDPLLAGTAPAIMALRQLVLTSFEEP